MNLSNAYAGLGPEFHQRIDPAPVTAPKLLLWNETLAAQLRWPEEFGPDDPALADLLGGNRVLPESEPLAMAYAGHQFGHFVPQLGDGRAHLLGEVQDRAGRVQEIQLKGSGPTRFSRGGDGRCAMGPALREFIMSEALHALGVPTTRCLAVVATGEQVFRDQPLPGAVVTRVADSHLRVGTLQYFLARKDHRALGTLVDFAIHRHDPELAGEGGERVLDFFQRVMQRQIDLVVEWLRVGFIHGVMNTDNTALSGQTIDFGPCAMLNHYDPRTVFSSIDHQGRYAFGNQPAIANWNMARLADCLVPLVDSDADRAIARLNDILSGFPDRFRDRYLSMMAGKLGLAAVTADDEVLIQDLTGQLKDAGLDYTLTFQKLIAALEHGDGSTGVSEDWLARWRRRIEAQDGGQSAAADLMGRANPVVIPRNHHVEATLSRCLDSGEVDAAEALLEVLRSPYRVLEQTSGYQDPPEDGDRSYQTFCGT